MVGDEQSLRMARGASPLATAEAEGAFGDRGSPGLQEGRELTSRDDLAQTPDRRPPGSGGFRGPPPNPGEKEAALDQEPPGTERGWGWGWRQAAAGSAADCLGWVRSRLIPAG